MILPHDQAKAAVAGRISILHLPIREPREAQRPAPRGRGGSGTRHGRSATYTTRPWVPVLGHTEIVTARVYGTTAADLDVDDGALAHIGEVILGYPERATLRQLVFPDTEQAQRDAALLLRECGHPGPNGALGFAEEWMRHHDPRWPPLQWHPCETCDATGRITNPMHRFPPPDHPAKGCPRCDGNLVVPHEWDCTDCRGKGRIPTPIPQDGGPTLARFDRLHADTPVWRLMISPNREEAPRWPTPAARPRGDELGYADDEALAVDTIGEAVPLGYQESLSRSRRQTFEDARTEGDDHRYRRFKARKGTKRKAA